MRQERGLGLESGSFSVIRAANPIRMYWQRLSRFGSLTDICLLCSTSGVICQNVKLDGKRGFSVDFWAVERNLRSAAASAVRGFSRTPRSLGPDCRAESLGIRRI